jgi:hypothetical protein
MIINNREAMHRRLLGRLVSSSAGVGLATLAARGRTLCDGSSQPGYKLPPPEIATLADARPIPWISVQPEQGTHIVYFQRTPMLSIEDASAPALTLGGAKFNPRTLNPHGPHGPELYQVAM